jgi:MFS family permease
MGLRKSGHALTLIMLYLVTMIMRASFYATIAVIQNSSYMGGMMSDWGVAIVLTIYPLTELSTVSIFGSYSDKVGRKPIFVASLFLTGLAAFTFGVATIEFITYLLAAVFGLGAASQVTTTLSMVADCSSETDRARLMGYYDLSTLGGLAGGYGIAVILLEFAFEPSLILFIAAGACVVSAVLALLLIRETRVVTRTDVSMTALLKQVARDRRVQKMLPVYIPIISLYGLFISKAEHIIGDYFSLEATTIVLLFAMLGGALVLGIIVMGHLSDYLMKRRPFIVVGLIGFGLLSYLLVDYAVSEERFMLLMNIWPVLPTLGFIAGSFPPAAMAYLTDISTEEARGSTMGVYSVFFGTGMLIGPLLGQFAYATWDIPGLAVIVAALIIIACIGTYFLDEAAPQRHVATALNIQDSDELQA